MADLFCLLPLASPRFPLINFRKSISHASTDSGKRFRKLQRCSLVMSFVGRQPWESATGELDEAQLLR